MIGRLLACLALLLALPAAAPPRPSGCPWVEMPPLRLPALAARVSAGQPVRVVAFGSSSTAGIGATAPDRTYPHRLQAELSAHWPGVRVEVLNRGVGGEDVIEMLARLERDVLLARPALVVWQLGVNAALRRQDVQEFRLRLDEGLARMRAAGAEVVLMDSQMGPWARNAPQREAYDRALAEAAASRDGVQLFSRARLMDGWATRGARPEAMLVADGLHHNDRGYACLAEALARALRDAAGEPR
ncbi:MAG: SGNH/GDSL hydrolase family protein [Acetobacteraceae bacterium]|nr:SGNH/GDSL hydrolase family protein [Acetobacteraceae bacterium]